MEITCNGKTYVVEAGAILRGADLQDANLQYAGLQDADLRHADLQDANLQYADLRGANLQDANLQYAGLQDADLRHADLRGANLQYANLRGADLEDANLPPISILPEGDITGWKKCMGGVIVKLRIPADAMRSNATGRKCRASKAIVLEVLEADKAVSRHDSEFVYITGETVAVPDFDEDWTAECSKGIHFFITRQEAEQY